MATIMASCSSVSTIECGSTEFITWSTTEVRLRHFCKVVRLIP